MKVPFVDLGAQHQEIDVQESYAKLSGACFGAPNCF